MLKAIFRIYSSRNTKRKTRAKQGIRKGKRCFCPAAARVRNLAVEFVLKLSGKGILKSDQDVILTEKKDGENGTA
jgi:hypothetical protein